MVSEKADLEKLIRRAINILRKNYSCPGPDGISYKTIKQAKQIHTKLIMERIRGIEQKRAEFSRPKKKVILNAHKKEMVLYIYNIYDRIIQECIRLQIDPFLKETISKKVVSHKRGIIIKSALKDLLSCQPENKMVLLVDLENYYSSIDKNILLRMLDKLGISENLKYLIYKSFEHCKSGLPIGNCLSPRLSDFYLTPIDSIFDDCYARFSDDMYFSIKSASEAWTIISAISAPLANLNLKINMSKLKVVDKSELFTSIS